MLRKQKTKDKMKVCVDDASEVARSRGVSYFRLDVKMIAHNFHDWYLRVSWIMYRKLSLRVAEKRIEHKLIY